MLNIKQAFFVQRCTFIKVLVGAAIGYVIDQWLNSTPWVLVLFMFLGGAAGILNVYRFAKNEEKKNKE